MRISGIGLAIALVFAVKVQAQKIEPPVIEYSSSKTTGDSFTITNTSETQPLQVASMLVKTFTVDVKTGEPSFANIDPSKISVELSRQSAYIQPNGSAEFFIRAKCLQLQPCWFTVFSSLSMGRSSNGYLVNVLLPHTVYLYGKKLLKKQDVEVQFVDQNTLAIKNLSDARMDRPLVELTTGTGKKILGAPIFPSGVRLISSDSPISKAVVKFSHFKVEIKQ